MDDLRDEPQFQGVSETEDVNVPKDGGGIESYLAFSPDGRFLLGTSLNNLALRYGGFDFDITRDQTPARWVDFSGPEFGHFEDEPKES